MIVTGAQAIVKVLAAEGVDAIFGYPGGSVIPLYNALYDAPFRRVLSVHEQGAIHAADGYARASGKVGVCVATAGPGATNLVTGLATAYLDSVPVIAITGQVAQHLIGKDAFQEIDIVSATIAVTKYNVMIERIEDLVPTIKFAFRLARSGRPGPILIDVPSSIQNATIDWEYADLMPVAPLPEERVNIAGMGSLQLIKEVKQLVDKAKRPLVLVGGGVISAGAQKKLADFLNATGIPVASTLMGLGAVDSAYPNYLQLTGMHGHRPANLAVKNADLIMVLGSRFSDRVTGNKDAYAADKTVIQFDIDHSELDKNIESDARILGNLKDTLPMLMRMPWSKLDIAPWLEQIETWRKEAVDNMRSEPQWITPKFMMQAINEAFAQEDTVYVSDVGQNQMWAAQYLHIKKPRGHITSGGCGTMGFCMPGSVGAKIGNPKARIVGIAGDGGFKMTGMEMYTAVREQLPLLIVVVNNHCLGMVRQWQHLFFDRRYSCTILDKGFDFVGFAKACGAQAFRAETRTEFSAALAQAAQINGVVLLEACIPCAEMVEPMVAAGKPIDEFVDVYK